jgi:hypothetical protein
MARPDFVLAMSGSGRTPQAVGGSATLRSVGVLPDTLYPLALVAGNLFGGAMLLDRHRPPISF